jgi:hypothetical protein
MISKTDFLIYLDSSLHLWAVKNNMVKKESLNKYTEHLLEQGYEVEKLAIEYVQTYLQKEYGTKKEDVLIQPTQKYENYQARTDILMFNPKTNKWDIYEVKSSGTVKPLHRYDVAFQYLVFKEEYDIGDTYILHLNKEYVKDGNIYLPDLFVAENVNEYVQDLKEEVLEKRYEAHLISKKSESTDIQGCIKPKDCPCISLCHANLPEYSIYDINKISQNEKRVRELESKNILDIMDIPTDFELTKKQRFQVNVAQSKNVSMDIGSIKERFNTLQYPLYFLDYETFNSAIPIFDGYKPFFHITFQYSLHVKKESDSELEHYEYLHTEKSDPVPTLLSSLEKIVGKEGSILVWNKGFEATRNKEMGEIYPKFEDFTNNMNERMFDLMRIFQDQLYDNPLFKGSYSIKNVLPVLVDDLSYKDMSIGEGATAMVSWYDMVFKNGKDIKKELLEYCMLDTLAMVRVWEKMEKMLNNY